MDRSEFGRNLECLGAARAPNGAHYLLTHPGSNDVPCVQRVYQGNRETILGFSGVNFESLDAARAWAIADGIREIEPYVPLSERKLVEGKSEY